MKTPVRLAQDRGRSRTRGSLATKLEEALSASDGERHASRFLKAHPDILFWAFFSIGGHTHYVVSEFGLGKSLKCDFVLMQSFSGGWRVQFVELEPVNDKLYNQDRTPSRRLRIAQRQIADWQRYVALDSLSLRIQLSEAAKSKNCLNRDGDSPDPVNFSGNYLRDPKTFIDYDYRIVIGRRAMLTTVANDVRSSSSYHTKIEIVSYDRLLDVARNLDRSHAIWPEPVYLPSSQP